MGLGAALTQALAAAGWSLVIDARDGAALATAAAALETALVPGAGLVARPGDITDPAHRVQLAQAAGELAGLELVVNNASALGPSPLPPLTRYPVEALREVMETNVLAPLGTDSGHLPAAGAGGPAADREHHLRRVGRGLPRMGWLRFDQGGARSARCGVGSRATPMAGVVGRPGRPADPHAPGRLPGRGHLGPAGTGHGDPGPAGPDRIGPPVRANPAGRSGVVREAVMTPAAAFKTRPAAPLPFDPQQFHLPAELEASAPPEAAV